MKVLYFHQYFSTPDGASGSRPYMLSKSLIEKGHEVTVICANNELTNTGLNGSYKHGKRTGYVDGIRVVEIDLYYSNSLSLFKRTIVFLRFSLKATFIALSEEYDLIFTSSTPLTISIPGIIAKIFRRKFFIFEVRDLWPELPKALGLKNPLILLAMSLLEKISYKSADHLIALAPGIADGITRHGISKDKVSLIPNGCDLGLFSNKKAKSSYKDISDTDFVAIFAGAHGPANGLEILIDVAEILKNRNITNIKILLVGDGKLKASLIKRKEIKKLNSIIFYDPLPKKELSMLFSRANIGLQILANIPEFYYGTSPNKFFDYISAGLPVINNYPGWLAEIIEENNCGFSIPPDKPDVFADVLVYASNNEKKIESMGKKSMNLAVEVFNRKKLSNKFVEIIELFQVKN